MEHNIIIKEVLLPNDTDETLFNWPNSFVSKSFLFQSCLLYWVSSSLLFGTSTQYQGIPRATPVNLSSVCVEE